MDLNAGTETYQTENTIFEAVRQCVKQIEVYIASDRPLSRRYATSMQGKLEVWAKYSGATSRQGLSLDDRVEVVPGVKHTILGLLLVITTHIKQALSLPDQDIDTRIEESQAVECMEDNDHALLHRVSNQGANRLRAVGQRLDSQSAPWTAVSRAIDSLFKIAGAIRESGNASDDVEVPAHYSRPDDSYFEEMVKLLVRRWFPHARRDLSDQLGHGVHIRRRKILYRQRHEEKLQFERSSASLDGNGIEMTTLPRQLSNLLSESTDQQPGLSIDDMTKKQFVAPSMTQFSQFGTQSAIIRRAQAATVVTGRTKGFLISENTEFDYPEPPTTSDINLPVFCPYCSKQLTQSQLRNWRRHVDTDLKPFICLSELCQSSPRLFDLKSDWLKHMDQHHGNDWPRTIHMTTWFCDLDHDEQQEFISIDSFRQHLTIHSLTSPEQDILIRHNQAIGSRAFGVCPLCEDSPQQKADLGVRGLFDHIADHLRRIALIALPMADVRPGPNDDVDSSLQSHKAMILDSTLDIAPALGESEAEAVTDNPSEQIHGMGGPQMSQGGPMMNIGQITPEMAGPNSAHAMGHLNPSNPMQFQHQQQQHLAHALSQNPTQFQQQMIAIQQAAAQQQAQQQAQQAHQAQQAQAQAQAQAQQAAHVKRDKNGRTLVARACAVNDLSRAHKRLEEYSEELDAADNAGNTPLQIASLEGYLEIVDLLLKKGCKINTKNYDKDTPLIDATENSHLAVVTLLLEAGANPRTYNAKGEEPIDLVDLEHEDGQAIKELIIRYTLKYDSKRRQKTSEEDSFTIKCICIYLEDDGYTILCEGCNTWQHIECYYSENVPGDDDIHSCVDCDPRPLDARRASDIQRAKLADINVGYRKVKKLVKESVKSRSQTLQSLSKDTSGAELTGEPYSEEFMHLYDDGPGEFTMKSNLPNDTSVTRRLALWSNSVNELANATNGKKHSEVFRPIEFLETASRPQLQKHVKQDTSKEFHGRHPKWIYLTTESSLARDSFVGELVGKIGMMTDYVHDQANRWEYLRHPLPLVFFHPILPIYIDTRDKGSLVRYLRRSCQPNLALKTFLENGSDYKFGFIATKNIEAGMELTIPWTVDEHVRACLHGGIESINMVNMDYILNYFTKVFSDFGGCACGSAEECAIGKLVRRSLAL